MFELLLIILVVFFVSVAMAGLSFAPWVPTWKKDIERAENLVKLGPDDIFYDLGCGDGRVVLHFAKKFNCYGRGVELAIPFYLIAKIRSLFHKKVKIYWKNLFKHDISDAKVIFLFGMPEKLGKRLVEKFNKELKPGTQIISYVFPLKGLKPEKVDKPEKRNPIYLYKI